ncbi:MAG: Fe-S cluster domain-containing protein [Bradymonadales bacterium]|jgi:electron transport complex protein RnfB
MNPELIQIAISGLVMLGTIGLFFGIGLAIAAHKFAVESNPKIDEVMEVLPQAQCGGCGYPGCEGYARAVVEDPDVSPSLCFPGKEAVAEAVAVITEKQVSKIENSVAMIRCKRPDGNVSHKHYYIGFDSCLAANLAFGGPSRCEYACIGLGDCERACPFDAIDMFEGMPYVNANKCVGCGACVKACPKDIIEVNPMDSRVFVPCSSQDAGKAVRDVCGVGCISCKICIKVCPAKAVSMTDNIIDIDAQKCIEYGSSCNEICVEKCPRKIFLHYKPEAKIDIFAKLRKSS